MKKALSYLLVLSMTLPLAGCLIRTGPRHGHSRSHSSARSCPPAHHWNGAACVHNGRARGHRK
jgi:hypothetical protein